MSIIYYESTLYHHGVKGQKWGIRRYQYKDGSLTPAGRKRVNTQNLKGNKKIVNIAKIKVNELTATVATKITGKQYVDTYLKANTSFKRIQTSKEFEKFAFYATYKKTDSDKYMGLFGKNLVSRANAVARNAEKKADISKNKSDILEADKLRNFANNMKVYQLSINATKKLRVPSDTNASDIVNKLLRNTEFKNNLTHSILDSKEKMRRPTQQLLFKHAMGALNNSPNKMTKQDKIAIYKAFNLSLTNHNKYEVKAQNVFYSELKKKGYNALLDYNDKEFSSYHAKRPMIVFDLDSVKLSSVTETNPKVVEKMYIKYNTDRLLKDIPTNTFGYVARFSKTKISECDSYVKYKLDKYMQ